MHDSKVSAKSRQCINSGALWFDPGDIITERDLIECKERKLTSKGEKSFTIPKEVLEKIDQEASYNRNAIVAFGFKNDDKIYCIADYNLWLELIQQINLLEKEIKRLTKKENDNAEL
jgi:hypothetical protein